MPGKLLSQVIHLVAENPVPSQECVLPGVWRKGNGQQWHAGLFRRATSLAVIAGPASCNAVGPIIAAAAGDGYNMVPRQHASAHCLAAVQAQVLIAAKQRAIIKRR